MDSPLRIFAVCFVVLGISAQLGVRLRRRRPRVEPDDDVGVILAATLTLLGLIIGFTFSMAVTRYDQRKLYESEEANAIGTEYFRAGLLPKPDAAKVRELLASYVDKRISFYTIREPRYLDQVDASTARLQTDLWNAIQGSVGTQPTLPVTLAVSGMNDVLNSQGYTQAAWWNRIPVEAWGLMAVVAVCGNFLLGYNSRRSKPKAPPILFLLPLIVSIAFLLIADLDTPRGGITRVHPRNLESVSAFMRPQSFAPSFSK